MTDQPPLLRVSRPVSACSRCRSAKVKCDGKLPACTACERAGKVGECTGGSGQFARGKERSYVASLESRIEKLQARLAVLDRSLPAGAGGGSSSGAGGSGGAGAGDSGGVRGSAGGQAKVGRRKPADDSEIEDLVADLGYLAINAVTRDFYGFAPNVSFGRIALRAAAVGRSLQAKPRARLPPRNTATRLVQHYIDRIFALLPCLSEASFFGALASVYRDEAAAAPFDVFCVYMVLGVGTMSLSRARDSPAAHRAACFVRRALDYAPAVVSPSGLQGVQATLLLVQFAMLEPAHLSSWYLIGVASRIMIDIGLHQEPPRRARRRTTPAPTTTATATAAADAELRRRVFYCVYALDRAISMVLQRPFTFADDAVRVELPRRAHTPTPMAAAALLFRLRRLQSEWYQQLHLSGAEPLPDPDAFIAHHAARLAAWQRDAAAAAAAAALPPATHAWLQLEWHYLRVYLPAPSPRIPRLTRAASAMICRHAVAYAALLLQSTTEGASGGGGGGDESGGGDGRGDGQRGGGRGEGGGGGGGGAAEGGRGGGGGESGGDGGPAGGEGGGGGLVATYHDALRTYFVGSSLLHALELLPPAHDATLLRAAVDAVPAFVAMLAAPLARWPDAEALSVKFRAEAEHVLRRAQPPPEYDWPGVAPDQRQHQQHLHQHQQEQQQQQQQPDDGYVMASHVATPDFGNVAFYRYV